MSYETRTISFVQERTGLVSLATQWTTHNAPKAGGITLLFSHSTSNCKEQWEIIVSQLFRLCPNVISEAWAIDWQNHGESAIVNQQALSSRLATLEDYADVIRAFIESPYLLGKQIVAVGHSTGTCAWMLAIFQLSLPVCPVIAVALFEPVYIIPPVEENDDRILRGAMNIRGVASRKDTFASREEAAKWARKRMPWKTWDDRMFNCYMEHGFHTVAPGSDSVTLNCTLKQEIEACRPSVPIMAGHLYAALCAKIPVHGIFGERPEMYSNLTRDKFFDKKEGRNMASVQIIKKAGHLIIQERPDTASEMLSNIILQYVVPSKARL